MTGQRLGAKLGYAYQVQRLLAAHVSGHEARGDILVVPRGVALGEVRHYCGKWHRLHQPALDTVADHVEHHVLKQRVHTHDQVRLVPVCKRGEGNLSE